MLSPSEPTNPAMSSGDGPANVPLPASPTDHPSIMMSSTGNSPPTTTAADPTAAATAVKEPFHSPPPPPPPHHEEGYTTTPWTAAAAEGQPLLHHQPPTTSSFHAAPVEHYPPPPPPPPATHQVKKEQQPQQEQHSFSAAPVRFAPSIPTPSAAAPPRHRSAGGGSSGASGSMIEEDPALMAPLTQRVRSIVLWESPIWSGIVLGSALLSVLAAEWVLAHALRVGLGALFGIVALNVTYVGALRVLHHVAGHEHYAHPHHRWLEQLQRHFAVDASVVQDWAALGVTVVGTSVRSAARFALAENVLPSVYVAAALYGLWTLATWVSAPVLLAAGTLVAFTGPVTYVRYQSTIDQYVHTIAQWLHHQKERAGEKSRQLRGDVTKTLEQAAHKAQSALGSRAAALANATGNAGSSSTAESAAGGVNHAKEE